MAASATAVVIHAPMDLRVEDRPVDEIGPGLARVRVAAGGICGSDLHYYQHGGFGVIRVKHPMVLGHEASGVVEAVGDGVTTVKPGDRVALNPSLPCGRCDQCLRGRTNHCRNMVFFGSAMREPHVDGAFRQTLTTDARRCAPVGDLSLETAAFAEPLAVCLHAVSRVGPLLGARVAILGVGPIGALTLMAARRAGAAEILAVDVADRALETARDLGADHVVKADAVEPFTRERGWADVVFECSGAGPAFLSAIDIAGPRGIISQVGIGGTAETPLTPIAAKELTVIGSFRFAEAFDWAVAELVSGRIDPTSLLTARFPASQAVEAFELAGDRSRAMKVQLDFS